MNQDIDLETESTEIIEPCEEINIKAEEGQILATLRSKLFSAFGIGIIRAIALQKMVIAARLLWHDLINHRLSVLEKQIPPGYYG